MENTLIHILLAEDHNIVRNGVRSLLEKEPGFVIAGEARDGAEAISLLGSGIQVDVVMADMNMPGMGGIELINVIKESHPDAKVVVLSMLDHEKYVNQAFLAGVAGYLLKM